MQSAPYSPAGRRSASADILPFGGPAINSKRHQVLPDGVYYKGRAHGDRDHTQLMKKTFKSIFKICISFFDSMRLNHVDVYSAAAAYYLFVSSVPFILALFAIIPFTPLTEEMVVNAVSYILPSQFNEFTVSLIYEIYNNHFTILSIAAVRHMVSLQGLNVDQERIG